MCMDINNSRIYEYQGWTLVDITNTGITKYSQKAEFKRNQQRNWETVTQLVSLRSQLISLEYLSATLESVSKFEFGSIYTGKHSVWSFKFTVEHKDVYKLNNDDVGILIADFAQTPIIVNLKETAKFPLPLLYTTGENKNIYFKKL